MLRIGIDLGGTKTEGVVMSPNSAIIARERLPTPAYDYRGQIATIERIVSTLETRVGQSRLPVGIGHPGAISPATGRIKNSNSLCLNDQMLKRDIEAALGREVRMANDANCLAVSEAQDGAGAGSRCVFGVILGTGVGGGIVIDRRLFTGTSSIAGEWGHNPLPWPRPEWDEVPGPLHWDGRYGSIEAYLSGPGLARDHTFVTGESLTSEEIAQRAEEGDPACQSTLSRFEDRLARALASVINFLDPDVIVLGGGLSRITRLYKSVPALWLDWVFSDRVDTVLLPALHGDSSGVRGAAWLWPEPTAHAKDELDLGAQTAPRRRQSPVLAL